MSHDDYRVLAARIRAELDSIEQVVSRAEKAVRLFRQQPDEELYIDAATRHLHDFYSALERLFLQIAKVVDRSAPQGERWHRDLLEQMGIPVSAVRPAVLQKETASRLAEYLRFRHVIRNIYSFHTDPQHVARLVETMRPVYDEVAEQLKQFAHMLEQWSSEAERA